MSCWRSATTRWSVAAARVAVWIVLASLSRRSTGRSPAALLVNTVAFAICVPLLSRFRHVRMPLITRRWYDIPLRAALVATLVATVVTLSGWVGPTISGIIALFPVVFSSMMLILHPRIGGPPTAAVIANSGWGLLGFGIGDRRAACRGAAVRLRDRPQPRADDLRQLESDAVVDRATEAGALTASSW